MESAKEIEMEEAAHLAGVHYTILYEWNRKLEVVGEEAFLSYRPKSRGRVINKISPEQEKAVLETS